MNMVRGNIRIIKYYGAEKHYLRDTIFTATPAMARCSRYSLFQAAFDLLIAFSASVEGSVIEMKPIALIPEDNVVSLKA